MKSARVVGYWYATAVVLVASALMRGISTPHMFPWWFVGAEFGGGIAFGLLAWWFGRGASLARILLLVAGVVVVLGAVALLLTGRGYEFAAVPAVLGVIATATGGEARRRTQQVSVPAVGDLTPVPAMRPAGPLSWGSRQDGGPQAQPPWPGRDGAPGRRAPAQHDTRPSRQQVPPQHGTEPQWPGRRLPAPPRQPTGPPQHPTYPSPSSYQPPARGAGGDPPWRRVPGPPVPALPGEPQAPTGPPPHQPDGDAVPRPRARHAAQPPPGAEPRPGADPEVQWAPRRRRHARPEQTEGASDPSHQEPEEI